MPSTRLDTDFRTEHRPAIEQPDKRGDSASYGQALRSTYNFFRRHSDRRYSDTTLVRLSNSYDSFNAWAENARSEMPSDLPDLWVTRLPFSFDEETEVKTGGTVGMLAVWRGDKAILTVHHDFRRKGIASEMSFKATRVLGHSALAFWVNRSNSTAQHFLLSNNYIPTAMNMQGALRYEHGDGRGDT